MTSAAMPKRAATAKVTSRPCTRCVGTPAPALSCAWPAAALSTVTSTASPSAAPTCWVTLTRPDAAPASAGSTPASPACVRGTSAVPEPVPRRTRLTKICRYDAPGVQLARHEQGDHGEADAAHDQHLGVDPADQDLAHQLRRQEHRCRHGQEAQARAQRRVALHVLEELADEEEHAVHAGVHQPAGDVGRRARPAGEEPQRHDRLLGPGLDPHEDTEQEGPDGERADRQQARPAAGAGLDEPEHDAHHARAST